MKKYKDEFWIKDVTFIKIPIIKNTDYLEIKEILYSQEVFNSLENIDRQDYIEAVTSYFSCFSDKDYKEIFFMHLGTITNLYFTLKEITEE